MADKSFAMRRSINFGTTPNSERTATARKPAAPPGSSRRVTFVYDPPPSSTRDGAPELFLNGSWNGSGRYSDAWGDGPEDLTPMQRGPDGRYTAEVVLHEDGQRGDRSWEWGVFVRREMGQADWRVFKEGNLAIPSLEDGSRHTYAPVTYHRRGLRKLGENDAAASYWAPNARQVYLRVREPGRPALRVPMRKAADGHWRSELPGVWSNLLGKAYAFEVVTAEGETKVNPDPYAFDAMGVQKGLSRQWINPSTGEVGKRYTRDDLVELMRFEIQPDGPHAEGAEEAFLVLKSRDDEAGTVRSAARPLNREELLTRIGTPDAELTAKMRAAGHPLWMDQVGDDGRIRMTNEGGAWVTLVNDPKQLYGLEYELELYRRDDRGELERVGAGQPVRETPHNDSWDARITAASGIAPRWSVAHDPDHTWKNDEVPRERDPAKQTIYQLHVGSFAGRAGNSVRSNFRDVAKKVGELKAREDRGLPAFRYNTVQLLPVGQGEGVRDWGYGGEGRLAINDAYAYYDDDGTWVPGSVAFKRCVDELHGMGLNVVADVVYNHVHGDFNPLWEHDGKKNEFFNWGDDPDKPDFRQTDWGLLPAFNKPEVRQFFVDHLVATVSEYHLDGVRFDFTEPIKGAGERHGWEFLREVTRHLKEIVSDATIVMEQFPYDPSITLAHEHGGAGGTHTLYVEAQHQRVNNHPDNPGRLQEAAHGQRTRMGEYVRMLTDPHGLRSWSEAVNVGSSHDEVGNAARNIMVAAAREVGGQARRGPFLPSQWARDATRAVHAAGIFEPGMFMNFQGDEHQAQNAFIWSVFTTWDQDWSWESVGPDWNWGQVRFDDDALRTYRQAVDAPLPQRSAARGRLQAEELKVVRDLRALDSKADRDALLLAATQRMAAQADSDAMALRNESPAFRADAKAYGVYVHDEHSVAAFGRKSGDEEFIAVMNLGRENHRDYRIPLPPGRWKEVYNTAAKEYGGTGFGNLSRTVEAQDGGTTLNLPVGTILLKRV